MFPRLSTIVAALSSGLRDHGPGALVMCCALAALCLDENAHAGEVETHGALRAIFHENDTGAKVTLDDLLPDPQLYAVGALTDLAGEITILGGKTFLSRPDGKGAAETVMSQQSDASATLLVAVRVGEWVEMTISQDIPSSKLDDRIEALAKEHGWKGEKAFAFIVDGMLSEASWHIIDGSRLSRGGSHEEHRQAGVIESREKTPAELIGFYSAHHQGVFTHMGSRTHVHCVVESPRSSGHLDSATILAGSRIAFPRFETE
jgi:acetolactate decarboxylase